jgi:putative metallohydrolase (TIGR04338 family)
MSTMQITDQTQAVYAAEDLWEKNDPQARIRFGDWHEVQPFYVKLAKAFRDNDVQIYPPTVRPRKGALKAHYDYTMSSVFMPPYDRGGSWALTTATAIHEFAHHVAHQFSSERSHGPDFRAAMIQCLQMMGWDETILEKCYRDVGLTLSEEDDGILSRVSKVYAQAEAPGRTVEEQKVFLEKAQRMAAEHSIDLALMRKRQADADDGLRDRPITGQMFSLTSLPNVTYRNLAVELSTAICHAHGCRNTIRGKSSYVTFYGFPEDVALTELMVTRVTPMMFEAADEYLKSPEHKRAGVNATSARITFCKNFAWEVGSRLKEAVEQTIKEAVAIERGGAEQPEGSTSTEIAIRDKEIELSDFIAHEFKRQGVRGSWKGSNTSNWNASAADAGRTAGRQANLFGRKELG